MNARAMLEQAVAENASDIFLVAGRPLSLRKNGVLSMENEERLLPDDTAAFLKEIYELADNRDIKPLLDHGDDDFSFAIPGVSRFRVSAYKQRGTLSAVIRVITFRLPDYHMLGIPDAIINLGLGGKGMTLITGPAGSGKSTTLACIIDQINQTQEKHIITLEDPLEFLHRHNKSIVSQREIHVDTDSYVAALRAALRQSPDVILLGEMRDYETIHVAMTAAETGHLLFSTLHTIGAANTIDRIIDSFPAEQQNQIRIQLADVLECAVGQTLLPKIGGGRTAVFEIMVVTPAIRSMILQSKTFQIVSAIQTGKRYGMQLLDDALEDLVDRHVISLETALAAANEPDKFKPGRQT